MTPAHSGDRVKTDRAKRDASVVQSIVQGSAQRSFWVSVAAGPVLTVVVRLDERLLKVRRRIRSGSSWPRLQRARWGDQIVHPHANPRAAERRSGHWSDGEILEKLKAWAFERRLAA